MLELPLERVAVEEGAAWRAALLGGVAGSLASVQEAVAACVRTHETIEPEPTWLDSYAVGFERFRALSPALRPLQVIEPAPDVDAAGPAPCTTIRPRPRVYADVDPRTRRIHEPTENAGLLSCACWPPPGTLAACGGDDEEAAAPASRRSRAGRAALGRRATGGRRRDASSRPWAPASRSRSPRTART